MDEVHSARVGLGGPREMAPSMPKPQSLQRQNSSTAQLIRRYELISGNSASRPSFPPSSSQIAQDISPDGQAARLKRSRRSISDSLRNLLSAFRKGKSHGKGTDVDEGKLTEPYNPALPGASSCSKGSIGLNGPTLTHYMPEESSSPIYSGILLYFARPALASDSPVFRVWTTCKVTLFPSHLLVTWFTSHGNPASQPIPLVSATNVRPLTLNELRLEERALLPVRSDDDGTKVFEICFNGAAGEKFAATSVPERVKWVNMLCDAIVPLHEPTANPSPIAMPLRLNTERFPKDVGVLDKTLVINSPPSASAYSTSLYPLSTTTAEGVTTDTFDHSLPPTPHSIEIPTPTKTPAASLRYLLDKQTSASPPSLRKSPLPATSPSIQPQTVSCPKSPSITRLDSLSVVKQRLAQMEGSSSSARSPSRELETRTNASTTPKSARIRRAFEEIDKLEEKYNSKKERFEVLPKKPVLPHLVIPDLWLPSSPIVSQTPRVTSPPPSTQGDNVDLGSESSTKAFLASRHLGPDIITKLEALQQVTEQASAQQSDQSCGISELVGCLREDIQGLPGVLRKLHGDLVDTSNSRFSLGLVEALHKIEDHLIETLANSERAQAITVTKQADETKAQIDSVMIDVLQRLSSLQEAGLVANTSIQDVDSSMMALKDLPELPAVGVDIKDITRSGDEPQPDFTDDREIQDKLDNLLELVKTKHAGSETEQGLLDGAPGETPDGKPHGSCREKLQEILDRLKEESERAKHHEEQQSESLRYLNELNTWLDTFVNNGTAQIQSVATTVQKISDELGCENVPPSDGQDKGQKAGLLITVRQLLEAHSSSVESTRQLNANLEGLIASVQDQRKNDTEQHSALVTDSIVELVNQQRVEQERLLRALSSELTEEIRGERLRFVEAMKEATAINVQVHVEHFKTELTREVMTMTEEVGRLHRQKQTLEQQIAELFTFYSKRKTDAEKLVQQEQALPRRQRADVVQSMQNMPPPRMKQRPLPAPFSHPSGRERQRA